MRLALLAASLCLLPVAAQDPPAIVGRKIPQFTASSTSGNSFVVKTPGKVTAVVFVSTRCPISNDYNLRLKALYKEYSTRVQFVFINANANEPGPEVDQHTKEAEFPFTVWKGDNSTIDAFSVEYTPETFVADRSGVIRYHGAFDDARNPARVTKQHLRDALDAVLAGKPVPSPETKAFGCTIKRARKVT